MMKIYRHPPVAAEPSTTDEPSSAPANGIFLGLPNNEPLHVLIRVYVVKVESARNEGFDWQYSLGYKFPANISRKA